ncbi:MAG TPA: restriction endonuclease subunit S [Pyrinomonadaceae bacterium]|nr:restriction endonuclease subunit S [Pyrinomonadaceae bacterium]
MSQSASTVIETARATFDDAPLPHGWRWAKLKDVCIKITDGTHRSPPNGSEGIPYITAKNIRRFKIDLTDLTYVSPEDHTEIYKRCDPKLGDVLYIKDGATMGIAAVNNLDFEFSMLSSVALLRPDPFLLRSFFLAAWLNHPDTYKAVIDTQLGSAIKRMVLSQIVEIQIPIPPIAEQERIEQTLSEQMAAVERARAAAEAQVKAAKDLPAAYLRDVFDSPEAERWRKKRIDEFAQTCSGSTPSRTRADYYIGAIPWVKTGELKDDFISDTEEHVSEIALRECSIKLLPADTLLIAMYGQGQTRGRTGLLIKPATTNQACFAVLPNPDEFDSQYLQLWFRQNYSRLRRETEGRGGNQPNLNGEVLNRQQVALPPLGEQKAIAKMVTEQLMAANQARERLQEQLDSINKLPAALLRQAFTGKL